MALSSKACRALIYRYFLQEGWLPTGTTPANWDTVTMGDLLFDDPPLPTDPHFQKRRVSLDLIALFHMLATSIPDPFEQLKDEDLSLGDFAKWCYDNKS